MSVTINFPFDDPANYSFPAEIEVTGGKGRLKLIDYPGNDFIEDFASDVGFTYNSSLAEFVAGLVRQVDKRPANSIVAANFNSSLNANWGAIGFTGLTANLNGTPVLVGGKVDCVGSNGIYYEDVMIGALSGDFVAKFKYTPHYTTSPPSNVNLFTLSRTSGTTDVVAIFNSPSGNNLRVTANGLSASSFGVWTPTAEQEYTFEVICIGNQISLYVDDVQIGTAKTITPAQGTLSVRAALGAHAAVYNVADGAFDDFILYSTAPQDENYTFEDTIYLESDVVLPEMEYTGAGTLVAVTAFTTVFGGNPRIAFQIGRSGEWLYWNGSQWEANNDTYAEANDPATFEANATSLPVNGEIYGQFKIYFEGSNTQGSFDNLSITLTAQIYSTTDPFMEIIQKWYVDAFLNFLETVTEIGGDAIRFTIKRDNIWLYYPGSWQVSNGTYAQSSNAGQIRAGMATYGQAFRVLFGVRIFFHSVDGQTTPEIDNLAISYDYAGETEDTINKCIVWGIKRDFAGNIDRDSFTIRAINNFVRYKNTTQLEIEPITVTPDVFGYWEVELVENENMAGNQGYYFDWNRKERRSKVVPNQTNINYNLLEDYFSYEI